MKKLLVTLAIVCMAGTAFAQVDPDPNGIGVYFDMAGTQYCYEFLGGPVSAYVVITNPTQDAGISGYECHVSYVLPAGNYDTGWTLPAGGLNVSTAPDFVVGMGSPLPYAPSVVVATLGLLMFAPGCMEFYVGPANTPSIPDVPLYADGLDPGLLIPLQVSSGSSELPVAQLNCGDCIVIGTEDATFGGVKAMYK
jgi:hypothetical protein